MLEITSLKNHTLNFIPIFIYDKEKVLWTADIFNNHLVRITIAAYYILAIGIIFLTLRSLNIKISKDAHDLSKDTSLGNYLRDKHKGRFKNYDEKIIYLIFKIITP